MQMIVIGADTHKHSHTVGAVDAATGRVIADRTVTAKRRSFDDLLRVGARPGRRAGVGDRGLPARLRGAGALPAAPAASASCGCRRS